MLKNVSTRNMALSMTASVVSSFGSVFLHILLAVTIYSHTGSGLLTAMFISLQWLPALLVVIYRSDWEYGVNPRIRWIFLDILSAILTLPILLFISQGEYIYVVLILMVRGFVDQIGRINRTVSSRFLFANEHLPGYASFLQSGYHIGISLAACAGVLFISTISLQVAVFVDIATFLISAILIYFSRGVQVFKSSADVKASSLSERFYEYKKTIGSDYRLFISAMLLPVTSTLFQGTYSVLQPIVPLKNEHLGSSAVSISYLLASVAIISGSSSFSFLSQKYKFFDRNFFQIKVLVAVLSVLAAIFYVMSIESQWPILNAVSFTLMVFLFEFVWMTGYAGLIAFSPQGKLGVVFGISFAIGCLFASIVSVILGYLIDYSDGAFFVIVSSAMFFYILLIGLLLSRPAHGDLSEALKTSVTNN